MQERITLKELLKEMETGRPFDIKVVKCSVKRGTGGKWGIYTGVVLSSKRQLKGKREEELPLEQRVKKNPNHYQNSTRNIYDAKRPPGERIVTVYLRLITEFNGKEVI